MANSTENEIQSKIKHPIAFFVLPFPPSVNAAYGGGTGQQRFKSKKYKQWLMICPKLEKIKISNKVQIKYTIYFPDNRIRDGQNYLKLPLDFLVNSGVLEDDNFNIVCSETWVTGGIDKKRPRIEIEIISYII